ncbi:chaplin [Streptomyces sp. NPDC051776]|uniref:chaplin n=1 Tax=Streptomyces sp. NPDC051776 TaxID=3155414 RepID=UPI00341C3B35
MNRIAKAATLTVAGCALVVGGAGAAMAQDTGYTDHGKRYSKDHDRKDGDDDGNSALAQAAAIGSSGFLSGNVVQFPINIPINACGNTFTYGPGGLNPAIGNACHNG